MKTPKTTHQMELHFTRLLTSLIPQRVFEHGSHQTSKEGVWIRRITIVGLIICCIAVLPAFAGTWRDDFGDGDFAGWEIRLGDWKVENGELLLSDRDIAYL